MSEYIINSPANQSLLPYHDKESNWVHLFDNLPSFPTTSKATQLDPLLFAEVIQKFVQNEPIKYAFGMRKLNYEAYCTVLHSLTLNQKIKIEIKYHSNRIANSDPIYQIQDSVMKDEGEALQFISLILSKARQITKLDINMEVSSTSFLDRLLEPVLESDKVCLEHLLVKRRYVGQQFGVIIKLIQKHNRTLKSIGRIGLSEAIECLNSETRLERLSLMNFDLMRAGVMESEELDEDTRQLIRVLARLGPKFNHLSYTTYSGFDLANSSSTLMLKSCGVISLRLTMQKGSPISHRPFTRSLLDDLIELELIGDLNKPTEDLSTIFPNLRHFLYQKQNLATSIN
uniref:F-box domain-containing protein n=1 Tax=Rhabditophanes sp. KR3021 TaxID=114890 RepID=A0AC35UEF0_9BILA